VDVIKASELRIGNWVESTLTQSNIQVEYVSYEITEYCKPIPLTEEILLNSNLKHFELRSWQDGYSVYDNEHCITEVKYLHQLQNLYFALTGEELKIEL